MLQKMNANKTYMAVDVSHETDFQLHCDTVTRSNKNLNDRTLMTETNYW